MNEPKKVGTIDLTPTWSGLVQSMMAVMEGGSAEGRAGVRTEFYSMARAADKWNEHCNAQKDDKRCDVHSEITGQQCIKERGHLIAHQWEANDETSTD